MKKIKWINYLIVLIMVIWDGYYIVNALMNQVYDRMATYLVLFPLLLVPRILRKCMRVNISPALECIYFLFLFLAQFLGSGVNLYRYISWFDLFTHFLSGIFTCFLSTLLLIHFRKFHPERPVFFVLYTLGIVFLVAGVWEIFEFSMDTFTGSDLQHHLETGVHDTMEDMIAAFFGSMLFIGTYIAECIAKKKFLIHSFIENEVFAQNQNAKRK